MMIDKEQKKLVVLFGSMSLWTISSFNQWKPYVCLPSSHVINSEFLRISDIERSCLYGHNHIVICSYRMTIHKIQTICLIAKKHSYVIEFVELSFFRSTNRTTITKSKFSDEEKQMKILQKFYCSRNRISALMKLSPKKFTLLLLERCVYDSRLYPLQHFLL